MYHGAESCRRGRSKGAHRGPQCVLRTILAQSLSIRAQAISQAEREEHLPASGPEDDRKKSLSSVLLRELPLVVIFDQPIQQSYAPPRAPAFIDVGLT